jgi:hypothetical protein
MKMENLKLSISLKEMKMVILKSTC